VKNTLLAICVAAPLLIAGCASTAKYEAVLNSWMGHGEAELVSAWGPPANVYAAPDGTRILTYNSSRNVYIPGQAPNYQTNVIGRTAYTTAVGGRSAMNIGMSCATSFTISHGKVSTWRYQGNNCTSR
jgi:hypothetical protein